MQQAMSQSRPQAIPVMCQMSEGHMILNTGADPMDFVIEPEFWADCLIAMREFYDFDGILCTKPGRIPGIMDLVERVDKDIEVPTLFMQDGARIECTRNDDAYYKRSDDFRFPELEELDFDNPLDWAPDSYKAFLVYKRTYDYCTPEEIPANFFTSIERVIDKVGDDYSVHGEVRSPMDHFLSVIGLEEGMIALITDPENSSRLLEKTTQWSVALAVAEVRRGAHAIKISSPFAGGGFLSPEMYKEFILPYESQIAKAVSAEGAYSYIHTCGAIADRLDLMVDSGISGIECLDPPPLGNVDLQQAVDALNGRIFIKGNIDSVNTLLRGDKAKVKQDVSEVLEIAGRQAEGFILSSACSIAPPVNPENVRLMVELCRHFKP